MFQQLLFTLIALAFALVSVSLAIKFIMDAYLDYIQVKAGIKIMTQREVEEIIETMDYEDEQ